MCCMGRVVLSRASAHGRLELQNEKLGEGAYMEEAFELLIYLCKPLPLQYISNGFCSARPSLYYTIAMAS